MLLDDPRDINDLVLFNGFWGKLKTEYIQKVNKIQIPVSINVRIQLYILICIFSLQKQNSIAVLKTNISVKPKYSLSSPL